MVGFKKDFTHGLTSNVNIKSRGKISGTLICDSGEWHLDFPRMETYTHRRHVLLYTTVPGEIPINRFLDVIVVLGGIFIFPMGLCGTSQCIS